MRVDGTPYTLVQRGRGWWVCEDAEYLYGPYRSRNEALSAAITAQAVRQQVPA